MNLVNIIIVGRIIDVYPTKGDVIHEMYCLVKARVTAVVKF